MRIVHAAGKDFANPAAIAIPWIYSPVASELGTLSLKQPRHDGEFHLMEWRNRCRWFAYIFVCLYNPEPKNRSFAQLEEYNIIKKYARRVMRLFFYQDKN